MTIRKLIEHMDELLDELRSSTDKPNLSSTADELLEMASGVEDLTRDLRNLSTTPLEDVAREAESIAEGLEALVGDLNEMASTVRDYGD